MTCYRDDLRDQLDQLDLLRRRDLEGSDIEVTVRYLDLPGTRYSNEWDIQPGIYEGLRSPPHPEQYVKDQAGESGDASGTTAGASETPAEQPAATAGVGSQEV